MKPAAGATVITEHTATLLGGEGRPLSDLAARTEEQRAERHPFETSDADLVTAALAATNGADPGKQASLRLTPAGSRGRSRSFSLSRSKPMPMKT